MSRRAGAKKATNRVENWVPGVPRDPSLHGKLWSEDDKRLAKDLVTALVMEGHGIEAACRRVGISERTFEKWRYSDPDLNEFLIGVYAHRSTARMKGKYQGQTGLSALSSKAKKHFDRLMADGKVKEAWLYLYETTKDRVMACRACNIRALDILKWIEEDDDFSVDLREIELQRQWMVEDILWRRGAIFKDASALRILMKDSKVGKRGSDRQKVTNPELPGEFHFHIGSDIGDRVKERMEEIFGGGGNGAAKQLPDSTEPSGILAARRSAGDDEPAGSNGDGEGALRQ